jgi:hypothetical protein
LARLELDEFGAFEMDMLEECWNLYGGILMNFVEFVECMGWNMLIYHREYTRD